MRMMYKIFYRMKGIRYADKLLMPSNEKLDAFPRSALFHYVPGETGSPDVETSMSYFQGYTKKIFLDYVTDYVQTEGGVRKPMFALKEMTRPWRRANRQKWDWVPGAWKDNHNPETLIVLNYGYLDVVHKYLPLQMASYHRWLNRQRTVWANVAEIAKKSERHQFLFFPIPPVLQGRTILDKYAQEPAGIRMMSIFSQYGWSGFMQLDMWKWLSVQWRDKSLMSVIDPAHYSKINLVFQGASGDQAIVNLGYLNSWIKEQPNTTEFGSVVQYEPIYVQKLFLKMSMLLNAMTVEEDATGEVVVSTLPAATVPTPVTKKEPEAIEATDTSSDEEVLDNTLEATDLEANELEELSDEEASDAGLAEVKSGLTSKTKPGSDYELDPEKSASLKSPSITSHLFEDLEKDMEALDRISLTQLKNSGVKLNAVDEEVPQEKPISREEVKAKVYSPKEPIDLLKKRLDEDAEANLLTAADYRKLQESVAKYRESEDPYGSKKPRIEAMVITPDDTVLKKEDTAIVVGDEVPDKTMAGSALQQFDRQYLKKVYKKDILKAVDSIQAVGVTIRRHEIDVTHSALGSYEHHTLEIKPVDGAPSTLQFTFPKIEEDGTFLAGGNKYLMRKQRVDSVLRKIAPRIVALSTYYGKTFVQTNPKVVNDSLAWLYRQINSAAFEQDAYIHDVNPGDVFDNDFVAPYIYNALAQEYEQMKAGKLTLYFNQAERKKQLSPELQKQLEQNGRVWCGWTPDKQAIVVDPKNQFFQVSKQGGTALGSIYDVLKLDTSKQPVDIAEIRVFSKYIPVGIVLGYYLGFSSLLALLGVTYRTVEGRKQKNLEKDEYAISFKDESYIFKTGDRVASMILNGFNDFEKIIKLYDRKNFENKDVYLNLLMAKKIGAIYVRELDMMENAFIDPISKEILEEQNEPTTFTGLMLRACELLLTYHHPSSQDRAAMRDRGYERFAGALYKELMTATRQFRNKNLVGRSKIDMSPYQVWNAIMKDNSLKIVEDTNPIQNLKESEVITYSGSGGRDKDTMNKASRAYHKNDLGVLSESTVDSSAVGTIAYLSANPNIKNVRGIMPTEKELNPSTILSTSALLSPAAMNDSPKRITFITTQHSHTIASQAYRQPYVRTGYESVIGKRTSKMFSTAAAEDGKVTAMVDKGIIVTYASGEQVGIELGRVYGKAEGTVYPHDIVSPLKLGDKFKKGDILAYNTKFFEPDFLDPRNIVLKVNNVVNTAFMETHQTHEDSCSISERLGSTFKTEVTKIKSYVIDFKQNLLEVRKVGEKVEPKDVLMIIEDEITASHGQFSDDALSTLKRLSNVAPRAGVLGTVEKIEVFYHGDKRDMSATLKKLADKSDNDMAAAAKASGRPIINGRVTEEYRVSGTPLELDKAEVRIYLTIVANTGVGDKAVFGHQMKSTVSEVHRGAIHTEAGEVVDATFSYRSVAARGVLSPAILGTTITLLDAISKKAANLYFGDS